jgi:hypothetical protein
MLHILMSLRTGMDESSTILAGGLIRKGIDLARSALLLGSAATIAVRLAVMCVTVHRRPWEQESPQSTLTGSHALNVCSLKTSRGHVVRHRFSTSLLHRKMCVRFVYYIVVETNKSRRKSREPIAPMNVLYRVIIFPPSRFTGSVRLPVS